MPVLIGLAVAAHHGALDAGLAVLSLLGAVLAHAGANVLNDVYDLECDRLNEDRVFPFSGGSRAITNEVLDRRTAATLGWQLTALAAVIGIVLALQAGPGLVVIGLVGLLLGWAYSAPPFRLSAKGLGELTVGLAFGVVIPAGTVFVQLGWVPLESLWAGLPYAFLIALVLYINQFPDYRADRAAGKRNWVVRLGPAAARPGYAALAAAAYGSLVALVALGLLPLAALAGLLTLPLHARALAGLWRHAARPALLRPAIVATLTGTLVHGLLVAAAYTGLELLA